MLLGEEDKKILREIYIGNLNGRANYYPKKVEEISELTAEEQRFFDKNNFVSPNFSVQTLYKISGQIIPLKFNRAIHKMMEAEKVFRTNFCNLGDRTVKIIFEENIAIPHVTYRNFLQYEDDALDDMLAKIMEADRRLSFNLEYDDLMRFSVFHTRENEYAVLVTMPKLIEGSFDANSFFISVMNKEDYKPIEKTQINFEVEHVTDPIRQYWEKVLADLPTFKGVPYTKKVLAEYQEKIYREKLPAALVSDLRNKSKSNKMMLMTILQTAWGFLLQALNKADDTAFCQLVENSLKNNSSLNVIPIRLKSNENETVENIVNKQFKQMIISQPYSFFDWESLKDLTKNNRASFDHFLSFLDFQTDQKTFSQTASAPFGNLVTRNSWDSCGMKLGIYFQYTSTNLYFTVSYDANQFYSAIGMRFAKIYNLILQQMLNYWNSPFNQFMDSLTKKLFMNLENLSETQKTEDRQIINDFIATNKILQGKHAGSLALFAEGAQLVRYFEGDRIQGDIIENNLVFVVEGKVARSLDTGDGWYNALDIISKDGWINETVFLSKRRSNIAAEVLTDQATVLLIPLKNAENVLRQIPSVYENFMTHSLSQMEKYQLLWLQS